MSKTNYTQNKYKKFNQENYDLVYSVEAMNVLQKCTVCLIEKQRKYFNKSINTKYGVSSTCRECGNKRKIEHRKKNIEEYLIKEKIYRKQAYAKDPRKFLDRNKKYESENPHITVHWLGGNYLGSWYKIYKHRYDTINRKARNQCRLSTPKWVKTKDLQVFWEYASKMSKRTGGSYHVDHIIPLINDKVCGLNVPWNLRVIPALDNRKKSNNFSEELYKEILLNTPNYNLLVEEYTFYNEFFGK